MNVLAQLRERFSAALDGMAEDAEQYADMVLPSQEARFGDYQANCAMPLGKRLGKQPRDVAAELVNRLQLDDICEPPEVAGPGFINLRIKDSWLTAQLSAASADVQRLGIAEINSPSTIVLDYSSPNVAKPMHVGHIRSTVIGDALYRVLRFLGHRTIGDNHIGDWGTQFGMIIYGYKNFLDVEALRENVVGELSRQYQLVNKLVEYHEAREDKIPAARQEISVAEQHLAELRNKPQPDDPKTAKKEAKRNQQAETRLAELRQGLALLEDKVATIDADPVLSKLAMEHVGIRQNVLDETAKLHAGDTRNQSLWNDILPPCLEEIDATYRRLGVSFNHTLGESFYHDRLPGVVEDLVKRDIAVESDGAKCVFLEGFDSPLIIQKQDGAFLYSTTDLATIQYRMETWKPDAILYVVDHRQSLHFEQLFATARKWGFDSVELEHIRFGTVLGEDGRPYKTRAGTAVGLMGLIDEAVDRAYQIVCQNDDQRAEPLLNESERKQVAERIGVGAIKYADLSHNRTSDYVFSYDKMLAMTGNTAAYMQYSYARVRSIYDKGGVDAHELRQTNEPILLSTPAERALALSLLQFAEAIDRVAADLRPNHLTAYLFELASKYSDFFENCPVLRAESDELRISRLKLCDLTARTIQAGLALLGIDVVERM